MPDFSIEESIKGQICGIDEVGRGPLAGPVVAAAVHIPPEKRHYPFIFEIKDSKKLTAKKRETISKHIIEHCPYGISVIDVETIDQINILKATMKAMTTAFSSFQRKLESDSQPQQIPDQVRDDGFKENWHCLIDGNKLPELSCPATAVIKGDDVSISIAAASVIAKVTRDKLMKELALEYPGYGWESNSGYGSKKHIESIHSLGITPHHRKSFEPVKSLLESYASN